MNCLDVEGRGWITTGDFYKFLKNFDVDVSPYSVCEMLGIYDKDLNGKISIE
jgi:Ca2+-binding EF-hand superfamily protein